MRTMAGGVAPGPRSTIARRRKLEADLTRLEVYKLGGRILQAHRQCQGRGRPRGVGRAVGQQIPHRAADLANGGLRAVAVEHAGMSLEDLPEGPVRDPFTVGQAPPVDDLGGLLQGLAPGLKLLHEPRLPDARLTVDRDEVRSAVGRHPAVERLEEFGLFPTTHHWCADRGLPFPSGLDGHDLEGPGRLVLPLQAQRTDLDVAEPSGTQDRPLRREDLPRSRGLFESRGDVDRVAGDHPAFQARLSDRQDLTRVDADAHLEGEPVEGFQSPVQIGQALLHAERGQERSCGVVLVCHRNAEHRHHRVTDELLNGPTLAFDLLAHGAEERVGHLSQMLGVEAGAQGRRTDEVREQDGDQLPLLTWRGGRRYAGATGRAEPSLVRELDPARLADLGQRGPALDAETCVVAVLCATDAAASHGQSVGSVPKDS